MTTPILLETYLRQIREVALKEGPRPQIVKLADMALNALETMRDGIVTVRRPPTASSSAETEASGSSLVGRGAPRS
jgi:hypothetical protein